MVGIPAVWLREAWSWCVAVHVPRDEPTVAGAVEACPPGGHVVLAPGMHVLTEPLHVTKRVQIIGTLNHLGRATSVIKHTESVLKVEAGGQLGLFGLGLWCHANDHLRRATITVDAGGRLHARHVQVKCVSGRYSSGIQVHKGGELLLHDSSVTCCTGSGIIIFGRGRIANSVLSDNSFNGLEVQKGASSVLSGCHIHGNGYSNNDDDLGSGVTVYGASSVVRVGTTMHLFFLTAKYSILSFLFLSVLFP